MDLDSTEAGTDFTEAIRNAVGVDMAREPAWAALAAAALGQNRAQKWMFCVRHEAHCYIAR
jgi:hypothetical protein